MNGFSKIAVIGSNSFSGASFIDHALECGMSVLGISRSMQPDPVFLPYMWRSGIPRNFSFFRHDLNTEFEDIKKQILKFRPDYIVNFAAQGMVAQSWDNPEQWFRTNTLACVRLHHFLKDCDFLKKYVQISTPEVYGSCEGFVKENTNYNPSTPYAVSKAAADMSLMTFFTAFRFPVVFVRSANVYGPGQLLYRIIPRAIIFFMTGRTIELHGGGTSIRSFIHINDVCKGIMSAMVNGEPGSIYHFASSETTSIRSLVKTIAMKTGTEFSDYVKDTKERIGKDKAYLLDCTKAGKMFGWKPEISLDKGLDSTIEWISDNIETLKNQDFEYHHKP